MRFLRHEDRIEDISDHSTLGDPEMNPALKVLLEHHNYRDYTDQPVSDADLDAIIAAAQRAPSSVHAQMTSLVVVRDPAKRADCTNRRQSGVDRQGTGLRLSGS